MVSQSILPAWLDRPTNYLLTPLPPGVTYNDTTHTLTFDTTGWAAGKHCGPTVVAHSDGRTKTHTYCVVVTVNGTTDSDRDVVDDVDDDCPTTWDPWQRDDDRDGAGDACQPLPTKAPAPLPARSVSPPAPFLPSPAFNSLSTAATFPPTLAPEPPAEVLPATPSPTPSARPAQPLGASASAYTAFGTGSVAVMALAAAGVVVARLRRK